MSSTRRGGVGHWPTCCAMPCAVGATNGTIARANFTQIGLSGSMVARPGEPPLRTKATGSSSHCENISGAARKSTMLLTQAGDDAVRKVAVDGVNR